MTPPEDAAGLHAAILDATTDCAGAMSPLRRGIDALDVELIGEASELMQACGHKMTAAKPLMEQYIAEHR